MKQTRTAQRRDAAIKSVKILLTSASLVATVGGWAAISAANGGPVSVAQVDATATVQAWLDSRPTAAATSTSPAATASQDNTGSTAAATATTGTTPARATVAPTTTVAPTATAVPTQVVIQPHITTRSSR
jgi:hypothetical protein